MKTIISLAACLVLITSSVFSQELIIKKDGSQVEGKILERTQEFVILENTSTKEKTVISVSEIDRVESKVQPEVPVELVDEYVSEDVADEEEPAEEIKYGNNIIGFNIMEFGILQNVHLYYERLLSDGYVGVALHGSIGLTNQDVDHLSSAVYNYQNRYSINLNIYPSGQHRASYFIGPSVMIGTYRVEDPINTDEYLIKDFGTFMINNGVMISITESFGVSTQVGFGLIRNTNTEEFKGIDVANPLFSFTFFGRF